MKAGQIARLELLMSLRARVRGQVLTRSSVLRNWEAGEGFSHEAVGSYSAQTELQAFAEALPGLELRQVVVDRLGGQVFALAMLDLHRASTAQLEIGRMLRAEMAASLVVPLRGTWKDRLRLFQKTRKLEGQLAAWEDTQVLLSAGGAIQTSLGPDPAQIRELRMRTQLAMSLLETMDLPSGMVSGLHAWRARRGLAVPSDWTFQLAPSVVSEWAQVMDLDRVRARWTLVLSSPERDRLAVWTFEGQAVGATRPEAMERLNHALLPQVQDALDRWFGFSSPTPFPKEAS